MPKAVISNRIFIELPDRELREEIKKKLTYIIPSSIKNMPPITIRNMSPVKGDIFSIPAGRIDLIPENYEIVDKRTKIEAEFPLFEGTLRKSQQELWDIVEDSCIINAWVSFGKTFTALAIAGKLGQKTLVVTHNTGLRTQWVKEVQKVYGITPGIIGSGKFDISTPIVIGNVQTLYNKIPEIYNKFGLILIDEMHHSSAATFNKILDKSTARYKIGLSGTIRRKDGKHVIFKDFFGDKLYQPPPENFMTPTIHIIKSGIKLIDGEIPWATKMNKLAYNENYQHSVALTACAYAAKGHKVLVVSDRVDFLQNCAELSGSNAICVTGAIKDQSERESFLKSVATGDKDILYGTQSIFSEGISLNELSCLILATPINNESLLEQLIGRVIRKCPNKLDPVIVDINLLGKTASNQARNRLAVYIKKGWKVVNL